MIRPLGLFRKRAASLIRFSEEYLAKQVGSSMLLWADPSELHSISSHASVNISCSCVIPSAQWSDPRELHGMGQYARDAYYMFCRGQWRTLRPEDKDLK